MSSHIPLFGHKKIKGVAPKITALIPAIMMLNKLSILLTDTTVRNTLAFMRYAFLID